MAENELDIQIKQLATNVAELKIKADKAEGAEKKALEVEVIAKAAELSAKESKLAVENAAKEGEKITTALKGLTDWQVTKDERDTANQKALNDLLKKGIKLKDNGETESFGDMLNDGLKEKTDDLAKFTRKEIREFGFQLKATDMTFAYAFASANHSVNTTRPGMVMLPNRKVHMRQLIPTGTMDGSSFTFLREVAGVGTVAAWNEATGTKAQFDLKMEEKTIPNEYIAGWLRMSKKLLDDVKGLTSYLNMRLPEKLMKAEDEAILTGDGTSPNISGITYAGNFTAGADTAAVTVERLIDAITQLEELDRDATAAMVRPAVYGELYKNKAAGSGEYDLPGNVTFTNGTLYVGGVPVFATTAMLANKYILGDFQKGIQILVREAPSIVFAYEDGTNIRENKVTVRIEERIALPIYGSEYFIYGSTVPEA